jgi:hypothetical protein
MGLLVAASLLHASLAEAQVARRAQLTGRILKEAPLYLFPDSTRQPLVIMEAGVVVEVHRREGAWVNVTVEGSQLGRRTGYVEARLIEVVAQDESNSVPPRLTAATTVPPTTAETVAQVAPFQPPQPASAPRGQPQNSSARALRTAGAAESFQSARINVTAEDKTREFDVIVRYEPSALVIVDKKSGEATKTFPYADMKGAEYSYAKSPRWKTAIFVSPLFLFTSGKKHWFLVQGPGDYALLHLDKSNYRLILAAFEARTGLKVETVADTK